MKNNYLLALVSAILLWLAWPPFSYTGPLLWVAFLPVLLALELIMRSDADKKGTKIFLVGGLTGLVWNTASIYWVFNAMNAVMSVYAAAIVSLIPFGLAALLMALAFRGYYQLRKRYSIGWSLAGLACFWVAYEYLHQTWDLSFPWMTLGNGFANTHQLIQWYEYTGVYGGTLWIWGTNSLFFLAFLSAKDGFPAKHRIRLIAAATALIVGPSIWSIIRYSTYKEAENPANIVSVQPNIDPYGKFTSIASEEQIEHLITLSSSVAQANTEFFIWPETAIARQGGFDEDHFYEHHTFLRIQQFLTGYKNGNVLSGIEGYRIYNAPQTPTSRSFNGIHYDAFNSAILIENSAKIQYYHKSKLVAGAEQFPFAGALTFMKPLFEGFGGATGSYGSQEEPSVFYSQSGIGAAPVICYESIWGNYVAEYIKQGAQFIAIITNDGWWGNTAGKDQHLAYAKLRAIETRRWVARSANTGISAFINQRGDIVQQTTWWVPAAIKQDINLNEQLTYYVTSGDYLAYIALGGSIVFGILVLLTFIKRRKH